MTITASMVKELREKTGAGMMDCKAALNENGGDIEASVDWLRQKGIAKATKKSSRVAADGLIGVSVSSDGLRASLVEVNAETDFVARNDDFQSLVRSISETALGTDGALESVLSSDLGGRPVSDAITESIATIGENISLRRSAVLSVSSGIIGTYMHGAISDGLGKIGVLAGLESSGDASKLSELGKQLSMHIAATNPLSATPDDMDSEIVEREKKIFAESARESGKPDDIIEKMVEGRIRKFYEENVLLSQTFVIDGETRILDVLKNAESDIGGSVSVTSFVRFGVGEGVEKADDDFAAEVASLQGSD